MTVLCRPRIWVREPVLYEWQDSECQRPANNMSLSRAKWTHLPNFVYHGMVIQGHYLAGVHSIRLTWAEKKVFLIYIIKKVQES